MASPPTLTDKQRDATAAAILTALLLMYRGRVRESLDRLGLIDQTVVISAEVEAKLRAFANERAAAMQRGIQRFGQAALDSLPADATPEQTAATLAQSHQKMSQHNEGRLAAFIASWVLHQALIDTYSNTPADSSNPNGPSAAQKRDWVWLQMTEQPDECSDAMSLGPAPLSEIFAITSGPPPVHFNCSCQLSPN